MFGNPKIKFETLLSPLINQCISPALIQYSLANWFMRGGQQASVPMWSQFQVSKVRLSNMKTCSIRLVIIYRLPVTSANTSGCLHFYCSCSHCPSFVMAAEEKNKIYFVIYFPEIWKYCKGYSCPLSHNVAQVNAMYWHYNNAN